MNKHQQQIANMLAEMADNNTDTFIIDSGNNLEFERYLSSSDKWTYDYDEDDRENEEGWYTTTDGKLRYYKANPFNRYTQHPYMVKMTD